MQRWTGKATRVPLAAPRLLHRILGTGNCESKFVFKGLGLHLFPEGGSPGNPLCPASLTASNCRSYWDGCDQLPPALDDWSELPLIQAPLNNWGF